MSSNGTKEDNQETQEPRSVFYHPVLCEIQDRQGQFGPFKNFKLTRPFLDPKTGKSVPSPWHTLNLNTLDQLRRHIDDLQETLDAENAKKRVAAKANGAPRRTAAKKKPAAKKKQGAKRPAALR